MFLSGFPTFLIGIGDAVLSESLWTRRYASDRSIVGKNIQINRDGYNNDEERSQG